jgi:hypothetical protein
MELEENSSAHFRYVIRPLSEGVRSYSSTSKASIYQMEKFFGAIETTV